MRSGLGLAWGPQPGAPHFQGTLPSNRCEEQCVSSGRISGQREGWMGPTAKGSRRNRFSSSSPAQQQQQQQQQQSQG